MAEEPEIDAPSENLSVPWFGVRRFAKKLVIELHEKRHQLDRFAKMGRELVTEVKSLRLYRDTAQRQLAEFGALSASQLELRQRQLTHAIAEQTARFEHEKAEAALALEKIKRETDEAQRAFIATDDLALLQEVGVYRYRHPLTDAVAYQVALAQIEAQIKQMVKKDGGAVLATTQWTVNGSVAEGRAMVRDFSKLMLRAFNAEADNLVRGMKPYKLDSAIDRLVKIAETIRRLGETMNIRISPAFLDVRVRELQLTSDFLQKQAEEKEIEKEERQRMRDERKAQQEIEKERERLLKEQQHYSNAFDALVSKGDTAGAARIQEQLADVDRALQEVDYRAANMRAGYVYVISNIGSFGQEIVKVGMTRRLEPLDRIRELSDASVPFNFDVHAIFFSKDAVGIETEMHSRLADARVNTINRRREFFRVSPTIVKQHLAQLAGELLEFQEIPEALEYRQSIKQRQPLATGLV